MPRSTMPVRGLRDTAPFHWDGVLGDPYGGNNSASIYESVEPTADAEDQTTSTRHLIDASLGGVLRAHQDDLVNDEGKAGAFTAAERDDLAVYLLSVLFPPAQRRAYDNVLSEPAQQGFKLFHIDGDNDPARTTPNVCGNCHRMPFLVSTNTPGTGMEAPTWRGAYDRFLILPQGRLNIVEFPFYRSVAERGQPEEEIWRFSWGGRSRFNAVWNMVVEGSTGFSGSFARQVTLSERPGDEALTEDLLNALEVSATEGAVVLEAEGVFIDEGTPKPIELQFDPKFRGGSYVSKAPDRASYTRAQLLSFAAAGKFLATFTGRHGENADVDFPQPAIWTLGPIHEQRGRQDFPILYHDTNTMSVSGRNFNNSASLYVDGRRVDGEITLQNDAQEQVLVQLNSLPAVGMHTLQVQSENGAFSNDFIFHVVENADAAIALKREIDGAHVDRTESLARAIESGSLDDVKDNLNESSLINRPRAEGGSTPLSTAVLHGHLQIAKQLAERGANVNGTNSDGNTPLHVAAFMCRTESVRLLLEQGASVEMKNHRGETPLDVVSSAWSDELAGFYIGIGNLVGIEVDLNRIEHERPRIAKLLREHASE